MPLSEEARRNKFNYIAKYTKEHYYRLLLKFRLDEDKELIDYLNSCNSKSAVIKEALKAYMKKSG